MTVINADVRLTIEDWHEVLGCIYATEQEFCVKPEESQRYFALAEKITGQLPKVAPCMS